MRRVASGVAKIRAIAVVGIGLLALPSAAAAREVRGPSPRGEPAMRLVFAATVVGLRTQIYSIAPSGRAPAQLTFSREPVSRLSRQTTRQSRSSRYSQRWEPRKPAPPVTNAVGTRRS